MKLIIAIFFSALLSACAVPHFLGDEPRIPVTTKTPEYFELPARFAFARVVYGQTQTAGAKESELWEGLAGRAESLGSFSPLVVSNTQRYHATTANLAETAREQRYNYLLLVRMHPSTGAADVSLVHVGSGGIMATAQAVSPSGGRRGFWGGQINRPAKLERTTLRIAQVTAPVVEEMLRGAAERQR